jgi:photosystem II stability/assembly factor-like uncharacterized protein
MNRTHIATAFALLTSIASAPAIQLNWVEDLSAPDDTTYQFTDVRVIGGDVYMSGYARAGLTGFTWKRSGGVWTNLNVPGVSFLNTIHGTGSTDIWVGGNSGVHHFNGSTWSSVAAGVGEEIKNIAAIDASHVVALGANGTIRQTANGGTSWTTIAGGNGGSTVGLLATATDDIWIGGNDGQTYMEHWDGGAYDITPGYTTPGSFVQAIARNGAHAYACGTGGEAWKLDGAGTTFVDIMYQYQTFASARDVVVDASGDAWFVGERAHVFHYDLSGDSYELQNSVSLDDPAREYTSIFNDGGNLIVVGNGGVWETSVGDPIPIRFSNETATHAPGLTELDVGDVAWGDYNDDGNVDMIVEGVLWRNNGAPGYTFTSVFTPGASVWGDYDNDGKLDIYHFNHNTLYHNESTSNTTSFVAVPFPDVPMTWPNNNFTYSRGATWADYTGNGFLDIYIGGFENEGAVAFFDDALVFNNQDGTFTKQADRNSRQSRGVTSCDWDEDGDVDIYVSNYRLQRNPLWVNDGAGNFTDQGVAFGVSGNSPPVPPAVQSYAHTVGSCWGDINNDGHFDLFAGNFNHHDGRRGEDATLHRNQGPGNPNPADDWHFVPAWVLDVPDWQETYGSPSLADYDNDGDLDLYFTVLSASDAPRLYRNDGNWNFTNVTALEGLGGGNTSWQGAWADFDNDGDLDLVTDGKLFVNNSPTNNNWLKVHLSGNGTTVNSAAIGSQARIDLGNGTILTRHVEAGMGEGNQNDLTLHFGLGTHNTPVDIEITWLGAGGAITTMANSLPLNQTVALSLSPPAEVAFTNIVVNDTICFEFESESGSDYVLQSSTDLVQWTSSSFTIHGLGQRETTYDPSGFDSNKLYRLLVME